MSDQEDQEDKPAGSESGSSDKSLAPELPDQDVDSDIPLLEEQETTATDPPNTNGRAYLQDGQEDVSEASSIDASPVDSVPRRAASPVDSVTSGRGDSWQVCWDHGMTKSF